MAEAHLGGHLNITWIDKGALVWCKDNLGIESVVDIGCGPGGMQAVCESLELDWLGVDGDPDMIKDENFLLCDFTKGSVDIGDGADLAWSIEFLEHVEEQYVPNFMKLFDKCDYAIVTAAPPGTGGFHHVNEQPAEYWIDVFKTYGFYYNEERTEAIKKASSMRHKKGNSWLGRRGMFFEKRENV